MILKQFWYFCLLGVLFLCSKVSYAQIVFDRCDIETSWQSDNVLTPDGESKEEGRASLSATGNSDLWFRKIISQTDVGLEQNGYLTFFLYVEDVESMSGGGHIEISSSLADGVDAYQWSLSKVGLQNGWNTVELSLASALVLGFPNLNSIRTFELYQPVNAETTLKIDFIRFLNDLNVPEDELMKVAEVDFTTLDGKVMFGYQGWFSSKGDGGPLGDRYHHWGNLATGSGSPNDLSVEMWFDDSELDPDELYETGYYYPDGRQARSFSSYNKKTVVRHMKWLRDYELDGVFLQRFMSEARDPKFREFRDSVAINVLEGCERYDRAFAMMWDGINYSNAAEDVIDDWKHLVDDLKLTESPNYLHHRGKPLVSIWGYTVRDEAKQEELEKLIDFFHNAPEERYRASIKLGCNHEWRTQEGGKWVETFKKVEVISPWTVGRYGSSRSSYEGYADRITVPDIEWCNANNIDYIPVNWPGFSWYNLHNGPKNQHARRGGNFFWDQVSGNMSRGAKSLYIAMFDEIDEATSFFKMPENSDQSPDKGYWLDLSADGYDLPSDWYLRCVKLATEVMDGKIDNPLYLETPPDGLDVFSKEATHATCGEANGHLTLGYPNEGIYEFSIDGGKTFPYVASADTNQIQITSLDPELYNVWVRYTDGSYSLDLGDILIVNSLPKLKIVSNASSCKDDGSLDIEVETNPYMGAVSISLDAGQTYNYKIPYGEYRTTIDGLPPGEYDVVAKWEGTNCDTEIYQTTIVSNTTGPDVGIEVYEEEAEGELCIGSKVSLRAYSANEVVTWSWTGPNDFEAEGEYVLLSDSISSSQEGEYTVTYVDVKGCSATSSIDIGISENVVPQGKMMVEADGELITLGKHVFCEEQRLILEASPNEESYVYEWSGPNGFKRSGRRATLTAAAEERLSGVYALKISDGTCFSTLYRDVIIKSVDECKKSVLKTENILHEGISVSPNPCEDNLIIRGADQLISIKICNALGQQFDIPKFQEKDELVTLRVADLPVGMFILSMFSSDGRVDYTRFIKK